MTRTVILASSSPYRRALLAKILPNIIAQDPAIDESPLPNEMPEALVCRLAKCKARALQVAYTDALIIGSDQVAALDGHILTKPGIHDRAKRQLQQCAGREVVFYTGLCVYDSALKQDEALCETTTVTFRSLSEEEIEAYLRREQPYDCAGAFKVEGLGIQLFESLQGNDPNALVGLPLIALGQMLRARGVNPLLQR